MPRFHFNVYDGVTARDVEGTELADWQEARLEAIRLAGVLFTQKAKHVALATDWRMEVTDESGLILLRLDFAVMESPAIYGVPSRSRGRS